MSWKAIGKRKEQSERDNRRKSVPKVGRADGLTQPRQICWSVFAPTLAWPEADKCDKRRRRKLKGRKSECPLSSRRPTPLAEWGPCFLARGNHFVGCCSNISVRLISMSRRGGKRRRHMCSLLFFVISLAFYGTSNKSHFSTVQE